MTLKGDSNWRQGKCPRNGAFCHLFQSKVSVLPGPPRSPIRTEISRVLANRPEISGPARRRLVSVNGRADPAAISAPLSLAVKFGFPETETATARDLVRMRRLRWRKAEHLALPGPFGWQVGEANNAHAVRKSPIDGCFDEIGCKEGKRDRHVYLADAAALSFGDAFRACRCIGDKFIKPTASAGNRCDQCCASFRTYRTNLLRRDALWQKDHHGAGLMVSFAMAPEGQRRLLVC